MSLRRIVVCLTLLLATAALAGPPGRWATSRSPQRVPEFQETPRVVLFTPHGPDDTFWSLFYRFMDAAAQNLGMKLEIAYADDSRPKMREQIHAACAGPDKADAVVFQSFKGAGRTLLDIAENAGVPAFVVNAGLQDTAAAGGPRSRCFKWWIGEMLPDDRGAGRRLAQALIDRAREDPARLGPDGKVHMIALQGTVSDGASIERLAGLREALAERGGEAVLHQVVAANWKRDAAEFRTRILLDRYPLTSVIWAANDPMALGAIDAIEQRDRRPGRDVLVGGVDWTEDGLRAIAGGTLAFSAGGHFMEGGWVMVLLHDWFHGVDFDDRGLRRKSRMSLIDRENLDEYREILDPASWSRLDFCRLSRAIHPDRPDEDFGPGTAMAIQRGDAPQ